MLGSDFCNQHMCSCALSLLSLWLAIALCYCLPLACTHVSDMRDNVMPNIIRCLFPFPMRMRVGSSSGSRQCMPLREGLNKPPVAASGVRWREGSKRPCIHNALSLLLNAGANRVADCVCRRRVPRRCWKCAERGQNESLLHRHGIRDENNGIQTEDTWTCNQLNRRDHIVLR